MADDKKNDLGFEAVRAIAEALMPLEKAARQRVLSSALALIGMRSPDATPAASTMLPAPTGPHADLQQVAPPLAASLIPATPGKVDIKTLREQKRPTSDIEMTVLVAYYLSEVAPPEYRKNVVTPDDLLTFFKQAKHPLPKQPRQTLRNAKNAGYLESAGTGEYRLNPVGHNLIAHTLPRETSGSPRPRRSRQKAASKKKVMKKAAKKIAKPKSNSAQGGK